MSQKREELGQDPRARRVVAARAARGESESVEDVLRGDLVLGVLEDILRGRPSNAPDLSDDEALRLAREEQHAARAGAGP